MTIVINKKTYEAGELVAYVENLEKENARLTTNEKTLLAERKIIVKENTELKEENRKLLQRIVQLEKDVTENESDCSMCDFPKLKQDLEKQIEKMKCCDNCNLYQCTKWENHEVDYHYAKCDDWKLKESV